MSDKHVSLGSIPRLCTRFSEGLTEELKVITDSSKILAGRLNPEMRVH